MDEKVQKIDEIMESVSLKACMLEEGDIPVMGEIYNALSELKELAPDSKNNVFTKVVAGLLNYLDGLIIEENKDVKPIEEGFTSLQAIWMEMSKGKESNLNINDVLNNLGCSQEDNTQLSDDAENENKTGAVTENDIKASPQTEMADEDIEILGDFIVESRENLETIELNLIELEQSPGDMDIINSIFRPFHTIKGVSGFLNLNKMNSLCHHTENLIDSARDGRLVIDNEITDIILESVDTTKLMLDEAEKSMETRIAATFDNVDTSGLIEKIKGVGEGGDKKEALGKILVETGSISENDLRDGLQKQKSNPDKKLGEILVKENKIEPREVKSALKIQKQRKKTTSLQVKVDTEKLDNLVDFTGELVIAQSMFREIGLEIAADNQKYFQNLNQVTQAVSAIQQIAMSMRMVPIKNTFQKMIRLVRDLARNSKKDVDLMMSGEDTEIDRNVVDELYEPMVHMIRNSVDHGLETPADREAVGKSPKGTINLRAFQKGGNIVIEIEDDGKGLDKNVILEKAIERNLVSGDEKFSDKEIFSFIMQPGFSTAKEITDVSGRGVGMDVVKKGIEKLRGKLDINSEAGKGSVFTISLPLTLAIVDGMLVRVGKEKYVIPTHAIIESFRPEEQHCHTVEKKGEMVQHRENLIPLVRVDRLFNVEGESENPWDGIIAVVENDEESKALLLDELLGKQEFVIKNLGESFQSVKGLAGGAILGDGKIGLILDMSGLFKAATE